MRPRLGCHAPLRLALDSIIANSGRGIQPIGDVLVGQVADIAGLQSMLGPDTSEAVSLELRPHRRALRPLRGRATTVRRQPTEKILDVMAVLVGDDVRLR